jgi:hypothetical protein
MAALILPLISNKNGAVYDSTVGVISRLLQSDVAKAGDPQRASEILVRVVKREHLPSHLLPGAFAVDLVQSYTHHQIAEAEACREVGISADSKLGESS